MFCKLNSIACFHLKYGIVLQCFIIKEIKAIKRESVRDTTGIKSPGPGSAHPVNRAYHPVCWCSPRAFIERGSVLRHLGTMSPGVVRDFHVVRWFTRLPSGCFSLSHFFSVNQLLIHTTVCCLDALGNYICRWGDIEHTLCLSWVT